KPGSSLLVPTAFPLYGQRKPRSIGYQLPIRTPRRWNSAGPVRAHIAEGTSPATLVHRLVPAEAAVELSVVPAVHGAVAIEVEILQVAGVSGARPERGPEEVAIPPIHVPGRRLRRRTIERSCPAGRRRPYRLHPRPCPTVRETGTVSVSAAPALTVA